MTEIQYCVSLPDSKVSGSSAVYRNSKTPSGFVEPKYKTLYENFQVGVSINPSGPCLGSRTIDLKTKKSGPYVFETYSQIQKRFTEFGSGLLSLSSSIVRPNKKVGWNVGIYSINRSEWVIAEQACNAYSLVTVALYDTLGHQNLSYIINHAELSVVVCSEDKIANLLKVSPECPKLKLIISMDPLDPKSDSYKVLKLWADDRKISLLPFTEVESLGSKNLIAHIPPKPDDICTICYTSGTTGTPKGVMLYQRAFVYSANSVMENSVKFHSSDVMLSYLPLAHCFERVMQAALFSCGSSIGFYRGDVLLLIEDAQALRPTFFPSVPRLFNRIYEKLTDATIKAPGLKGVLARKAVQDKLYHLEKDGVLTHSIWDRILFNKIAALLGGRVRLMLTGSAPISGSVLNFLRICFSCEIIEGYGQTEGAAGSSLTFVGDYVTQHVGGPLSCNDLKLVDVPEMGYFTASEVPVGEICLKGPNVMKGYLKDEEKTKETIDKDGWLHTGDIGKIIEGGRLCIIDRKKNLFKLSQGEYVAPEKLEADFVNSKFIMQCFVHGDSLKSELVAIVVPDPVNVVEWSKKNLKGASALDLKKLCESKEVKELILKEISRVGKAQKLAGYELPKNIYLEHEQFTIENDLLTPSFKLKRNIAQKKYDVVIKVLYEELEASKETSKAKL